MTRSGHLIVRVPELELLLAEAGDAIPAPLKRMRRLGTATALNSEAAGTDLVVAGGLSAAAASRYFDVPASGDDSRAVWLRADPVSLKADLRSVWVQPAALAREAEVAETLAPIFAEVEMTLEFPHLERGYVRLTEQPACRFSAPDQIVGESMETHLPSGPDEKLWRRLGNEVQMALHALSQRGELGFQGLWFWGAGALPSVETAQPLVDWVVSQDPVLCGAANWASVPCLEPCEIEQPGPAHPGSGLIDWRADASLSASDNLSRLTQGLGRWLSLLRWRRIGTLSLAGRSQMHSLVWWRSWRPMLT